MKTFTKLLVGFLVLMGGTFIFLNTAQGGEYLHQPEAYSNAVDDAKIGYFYGMTITCQTNEAFKDDRCMRGNVMGSLTNALRAAYYVEDDGLEWIAEQYAGTKLETMFKTRIVKVNTTTTVTREFTQDEINAAADKRIDEIQAALSNVK